jgi:uncharacterized protein (DUF1810 family)
MSDDYNLHRFLGAQERVYDTVLDELRGGRKSSHWIWFIFPQIAGLGHSTMAQQFAITSLDEAKAYLQHPILGPRLRTCTQLVLNLDGRNAEDIFSYPDNLKFRSCMTLFLTAAPDNSKCFNLFMSATDRLHLCVPSSSFRAPAQESRHGCSVAWKRRTPLISFSRRRVSAMS